MANLTPEDLEFIAMLEAKAKASKQEDFRRKARIAQKNRAAKNLARKKKDELKLIENSLANHPQPINNQEIELNNDLGGKPRYVRNRTPMSINHDIYS